MAVPLATSVMRTCAPGMTASLASFTLPVIVPRASCALADDGASRTIVAKTAMANACNNLDAAGFIYVILLMDGKQSCGRPNGGGHSNLGRVSPSDRNDPRKAIPWEPI